MKAMVDEVMLNTNTNAKTDPVTILSSVEINPE